MTSWYYITYSNSTGTAACSGSGYYSGSNYYYADSSTSTTMYYDVARRAIYIDGQWVTDLEQCNYPERYETEEQKLARLEHQRQYEAEQEKIRKEQEVAKQKADELLKSHIGVEAFGKLHEIGHIELDSQKYQGRKYRIPNNARSLIEIVEAGKVVDRLCVHPIERYQDGDEILTRLTLLQYAEEYLLKVANHNLVRV